MFGSPIRRRFWCLLFGVLSLVAAAWLVVEWDMRRMERAVWTRSDFSGLEIREGLLHWISENRVTPKRLRARVDGLIGDLTFHRGREGAYEWYVQSLAPFTEIVTTGKMGLSFQLEQLAASRADFGRGYADFTAAPFHPPPLGDEDLAAPLPEVKAGENAWSEVSEIPPIDREETLGIRELLSTAQPSADFEEIDRICRENRQQIESLGQLENGFALPEPHDIWAMAHLADFARLLMLDSLRALHAGDTEQAERSFDAAYRVIGFFEQTPGLVNGLAAWSLRKTFIRVMRESQMGKPAAALFSERHLMKPGRLEWILKSEYQSTKALVDASYTDRSPVGLRQRQRVLEKHRDYYRAILADFENTSNLSRSGFEDAISRLMFRHRRLLYRFANGTYAEGRQFAETAENVAAEVVFWTAVPNLGRFDQSIESIEQDERKILAGDIPEVEEITRISPAAEARARELIQSSSFSEGEKKALPGEDSD